MGGHLFGTAIRDHRADLLFGHGGIKGPGRLNVGRSNLPGNSAPSRTKNLPMLVQEPGHAHARQWETDDTNATAPASPISSGPRFRQTGQRPLSHLRTSL